MNTNTIISFSLLLLLPLATECLAEKKNSEPEKLGECPAKCKATKINKNVNMVDKVFIVVSSPAEVKELISKGVSVSTEDVEEQKNKSEDKKSHANGSTEKIPTSSKPMFVSNIDLMRTSETD